MATNEEQLEILLQKAKMVHFIAGSYSLLYKTEIPCQTTILFNYEDAYDVFELYKYLVMNKVSIFFKQPEGDRVDLTLTIEKDESVILSAKRLKCGADRIKDFFKRQPVDKPMLLFLKINQPPDSLEEMALFMKDSSESKINEGIAIPFWKGMPMGISP